MAHQIRVLSEEDVRSALSMEEAIDVMAKAFAQLSNGSLSMPVRMVSHFDDTMLFYKPAASKNEDIIGVKLLTQVSSNRERSLPVIQGIIVLTDYHNGRFLALMDGTHITSLRTGATSGLATKWLSREQAKVAAIFGAGAQGRTQLSAICKVRAIEKAYIFDINAEAISAYIYEMQPVCNAKLIPGSTLDVLKEVDIICTATDSSKPLFNMSHLKKGVHINAIGSFRPCMTEIEEDVMVQAKVYVDHKESALAESGDLINPVLSGVIAESHIVGEIGALINGQIQGRTDEEEVTVFKSVGVAVQDLAAAYAVYQSAIINNLGQMIHL